MTTQEIIDELNAACLHGIVSWVEASDGGFAAASPSKTVYLPPEEAAREAAALRRNREALNLDAIMPLLEQIASRANSTFIGPIALERANRVGAYLAGLGFDEDIPTTFADVVAVVEAWKARRQ